MALAGAGLILIELLAVAVWMWRMDDATNYPIAAPVAANVPIDESPAVVPRRVESVRPIDPGGMFLRMREMRPGPPHAMEEIERLQEEQRDRSLAFHPRPTVPPIPTAPHVGPPDVQEILDRIHSHYPVESTPGAEHVTYGPTHFEYRVDYAPSPGEPAPHP